MRSIHFSSKSLRIGVNLFSLLSLLFITQVAFAQSECAANFKVEGDPRNGASYLTFVTIPNLDIHSALGQIEKNALDQDFKIGAENYSGDQGTLTIVHKDSLLHPEKVFPIMIGAYEATNRLAITLRLNPGGTVSSDSMRDFMCSMLSKVTMDSAGVARAAEARAQTHSDEIINVKAPDLAFQLDKALAIHAAHPEYVAGLYIGKVYRIDGQVSIPIGAHAVGAPSFDIQYITSKFRLLPGITRGIDSRTAITCRTDPKQAGRFIALRNDDYATLIAKVVQLEGTTLYLDCHFEN
ncbi:hypothetical protein [Dyella sp. Tek66A03]|uniref:hypothetical protein n=1 Tax=Dyella sp. Tek66A03 TaxID=3458298 RepID=UPI00403E6915